MESYNATDIMLLFVVAKYLNKLMENKYEI